MYRYCFNEADNKFGWYVNKKVGVVAAVLAINAFLRAVNAQFF